MDLHLLGAFVATCLLVSLTPGLCSMLCLSLATTVGLRRTQWMMLGEVAGMGSVAAAAVLGIAAVAHAQPAVFDAMKLVGSVYLMLLGWKAWRAAPTQADPTTPRPRSRLSLAGLGFATAITNPKVWALYVALLPPFVDASRPLGLQLAGMLAIIVAVELAALYAYAVGGRLLVRWHERGSSSVSLGRIIGVLMMLMGAWMLFQ